MKIQHQAGLGAYKASGFIGDYCRLVRGTVIPYQYEVLCDRAGTEKSHVIANFENAARALRGEDTADGFYGMVFQDSDAAKWLEAAACSLANERDPELEARADELIALIASAQDEDGYLNTRFTVSDREKRWTNLLEGHELYCAGHLMEAAAAYFEATGKRTLLDVCLRNAEHIYKRFVTDGAEGYPGHPEIELALMRLYRAGGDERCLELARHFIDVRGVDPEYFRRERESRDWTVWGSDGRDSCYQQSDRPVRELKDATGHAVRAVYLYTAMADLAAELEDKELEAACRRLWESITRRRLYVTGGIGSTVHGEAFSVDFDLPSDTAYAETCASLGLMFFASRMLELDPDSRYADVMEQAFYNTVLSGMSLDGKSFFYVNPLESVPGISGKAPTHRHTLTVRPGWYACACCPPNAARTVMSFGRYAYGESSDTAYCHLYAAGEVKLSNGMEFTCETAYPFGSEIRYRVAKGGRFAVRLPHWSKKTALTLDGRAVSPEIRSGYAYLDVPGGSELTLTLDCGPRYVYASPEVPELTGKVCICAGPLVFCFEDRDNPFGALRLILDTGSKPEPCTAEGLEGIPALEVRGYALRGGDTLYSDEPPAYEPVTAKAVPYYARANRGETGMSVWRGYVRN
ncbi:MAG: glycoside hydrolase family 127 protein [Ruminococcus sp.]|nr:glycoside hydrolase family 127 protein [Ruminococcus sp.]